MSNKTKKIRLPKEENSLYFKGKTFKAKNNINYLLKNNFYRYINLDWIKSNKVPNDNNVSNVFSNLQKKIDNELKNIVVDEIVKKKVNNNELISVQNLYYSSSKWNDELVEKQIFLLIYRLNSHKKILANNKEDDWSFIDILSSLLAVVNDLKQQNNKSKKETIKKCIRCDRTGHTEENCYAKTDKRGEELLTFGCEYVEVFACEYCGKEFETEKGARFHENVHCTMKNKKAKQTTKSSKNKCFRCGRENHYADECYASKHINGKYL